MKKNKSMKNYIILGLILILTGVLAIYFFKWYSTYQDSKLKTMILDEELQVIRYNEIDDYLIENKDTVIYVSELDNQEIRNFESKLKGIIKKYNLNSSILYLNTSDEDNAFKTEDITKNSSMKNLPLLVVYKEGKIDNIYDIKENNYSIKSLVKFLRKEGIIND